MRLYPFEPSGLIRPILLFGSHRVGHEAIPIEGIPGIPTAPSLSRSMR